MHLSKLLAWATASFGMAALTGSSWADSISVAAPVDVGDGTVDATRLRPYDNASAVTYDLANGEKIETGIWSDRLQVRDVNGRKAWVRIQSMASFNGLVITSVNVFDAATFAPISTILKNRNGSREYWTFTGNEAVGHIVAPDGHETMKTMAQARPAYDFNCCMASLIPAALPLSAGKSFTLPAVITSDGDHDTFVFHVKGRERIKAGFLGTVDTWVVESHQPSGGTVTFWITDKPRRLVRERLTDFPSKTCTAPEKLEAAACPAQATIAGVQYNQTFELIGGSAPRH